MSEGSAAGRRTAETVGRYVRHRVRDRLRARERRTDRYLLEDVIFPTLIESPEIGAVLFVGTAPYTRDYEVRFGATRLRTIDVDVEQAPYGSHDHIIGSFVEVGELLAADTFDAVVVNGVIGFGMDDLPSAERAFQGAYSVLRPGGWLILGWNEAAPHHPFPPDDIVALKLFVPEALPPFATARYPTYSPLRHVFDFYRKPLGGI